MSSTTNEAYYCQIHASQLIKLWEICLSAGGWNQSTEQKYYIEKEAPTDPSIEIQDNALHQDCTNYTGGKVSLCMLLIPCHHRIMRFPGRSEIL